MQAVIHSRNYAGLRNFAEVTDRYSRFNCVFRYQSDKNRWSKAPRQHDGRATSNHSDHGHTSCLVSLEILQNEPSLRHSIRHDSVSRIETILAEIHAEKDAKLAKVHTAKNTLSLAEKHKHRPNNQPNVFDTAIIGFRLFLLCE